MATFHTAIYSADVTGTSHIPCIQEATVHKEYKKTVQSCIVHQSVVHCKGKDFV